MPGRLRTVLRDGAAAVARAAPLVGSPKIFQDPKYDVIGARLAAWPQISVLVAKLCAEKTMKELVAAGQALGVPITAVLTPSRILASEHFQAVGAITDAELVPGCAPGCLPDTSLSTGSAPVSVLRPPPRGRTNRAGSRIQRRCPHPQAGSAAIHSKVCGFLIWASSWPAASSAGCSATWAPRSSRSKVPTTPTGCGRPESGMR